MGVAEPPSSGLSQELFEELSRVAFREEETLRLEFINGKIEEKAVPDGGHGRIIQWLSRLCI